MSENIFNQNIPEIDLRDALVEPLTAIDKLELNQNDMKYKCEAYFLNLQGKIIKELEKLEGKRFNIERTLKENVGLNLRNYNLKLNIILNRELVLK